MPIKAAPNKIYRGVHIKHFIVDSKVYEHVIIPEEGERIECLDEDQNVVLTFTTDEYVKNSHGQVIGKLSINRLVKWEFTCVSFPEGKKTILGDSLNEAEIEVSKMYIRGELK